MLRTSRTRVIGSGGQGSNPFVDLMISALLDTERVDYRPYTALGSVSGWPHIWHFNWPEQAYRGATTTESKLRMYKLIGQIDAARLRGTRIAWTVHNLRPHEADPAEIHSRFWRAFRRRVDLFVHLSDAGGSWFREMFPETDQTSHLHLRHPPYPIPDGVATSRSEAREAAGLSGDEAIVLIPGLIRPYKGIPDAVRSFASVGDGFRLVVAGEAQQGPLRDEIVRECARDPRVDLRLGILAESEVHNLVRASDVVLIPYKEFLNSGVLMLALSHRRPVVVRSTPVTEELRAEIGTRWVRTFSSEQSLIEVLESARTDDADMTESPGPLLDGYGWDSFATKLAAAYETLRNERRARDTGFAC